jgi:NADPH:quinone reductase-like Zn-dependent oxidoreductase
MPRTVRFDSYGGVEVFQVRDVTRPVPAVDQVLVEVRAAAINPKLRHTRGKLVLRP